MGPLYTIGHSTRTVAELIDILRAVGVTRLVDIRRFPRSRTNPQFNQDTLQRTLSDAGISYDHVAALGGRRIKSERIRADVNAGWQERAFHDYADYAMSASFRAGLRELLEMTQTETCAIMCAEALWWRCHRRIVTDHVLAHGVPVVHLFTRTHRQQASLTPFAVVGARARVSYPATTPVVPVAAPPAKRARERRPRATREAAEATYEMDVVAPYRLDLTVIALRRSAMNIVDVLTGGGTYLRVLDGFRDSVVVRVSQTRPDSLTVALERSETHARDDAQALSVVRRMLGVDRELSHFNRVAARIPWLRPLATRMLGVKPPRYSTLWEACVNAIVFQQISLIAASTICRRVVMALSPPIEREGLAIHAFPSAGSFQRTSDDVLRGAGLSPGKLAALRRVADAILTGALDETMLEERSSADAAALLCRIKGIGPWTATVILLRGLGRLDVFPMNDSSVAKNLSIVAREATIDVPHVLSQLGAERGMLYYHLLLARLDARGEVGIQIPALEG